jgi:hypothetical protein
MDCLKELTLFTGEFHHLLPGRDRVTDIQINGSTGDGKGMCSVSS